MDGPGTSNTLFPVSQIPVSGDVPAGNAPVPAFTSFNVETFRSQAAAEALETSAQKEAKLQRAAEYFIPSSSESDEGLESSDEDAETSRRTDSKQREDTAVQECHIKKKRKRHKEKKEKHGRHAKRPKSDAEKIIDLERREAAAGKLARAALKEHWASSEQPAGSYIDTHGDRDNLAFDGLYRANIAAYSRLDPTGVAKGTRPRYGYVYGPRGIGAEVDDDRQRGQRGKRRRYFLAAVMKRERDGRLERWRIHHLRLPQPALARSKFGQLSRLPLDVASEHPSGQQQGGAGQQAPSESGGMAEEEEAAETAEQHMMRRTREFNVGIRERPHDLQLWLDFAAFQDELGGGGRRASGAGVAEKKIAILEQALRHHPGSDELLLALLGTVEVVLSGDDVEERWRRVLAHHGGSARLWQAFLSWQRARFGSFSCSVMRVAYGDAIIAMVKERARRRRESAPHDVLVAVERDIGAFFIEYLGLELQSGHTEQAVACLQAALEYNFFSADFDGAPAKIRSFRAFWNSGAALVGDEGARGWCLHGVPEEVPAEAPAAEEAQVEEAAEEGGGGWGGWVELPASAQPAAEAAEAHSAAPEEDPGEEEEDDAEADISLDEGEIAEEETEEELMARLGLKLEQELAQLDADKALDSRLARRWAAQETARDRRHWQPLRGNPPEVNPDGGDSSTSRPPEFEDIDDFLFTLDSEEARQELVLRCLALLGLSGEAWDSSNAAATARCTGLADTLLPELVPILPSWRPPGMPPARAPHCPDTNTAADLGIPVEAAPTDAVVAQLGWLSPLPVYQATAALGGTEGETSMAAAGEGPSPVSAADPAAAAAAKLVPISADAGQVQLPTPWYLASEERRQFAVRLLQLLALGRFSSDTRIADALLSAEAAEAQPLDAPAAAVAARNHERAQATAQRLLAKHRGSLPLWQAYAKQLLDAQQTKAARKVYDTMLASLPAMPQSYVRYAPSVVLAYAAAEVGLAAADSAARAMHVLAWLGTGGPYSRYSSSAAVDASSASALSADRLVHARRGYQDMLSTRLSSADGKLSAANSALVSCAALFEELLPAVGGLAVAVLLGSGASGVPAAAAVYRAALDIATLEVRRQSAEHEALQVRLCCLLARECAAGNLAVSPGWVRTSLLDALKVYPRNSALLGLLAIMEMRAHTVSRLRRDLRSMCEATSSPQLWLLALRCEAALPGGAHRVQALFERALSAKQTQQCALLWRAYIGYELSRGRPEAARRVFLRAIHACSWCKALWMDGLVSLGDVVSARERAELLDVMREKDVRIRTDTYEILLESIGEQQLV